MSVSKLKKKLTAKKKKESVFKEEDLLSTGSTLLNLALSGNPRGGIPKGKYVYLVGDTSSGKTALSLTMLAEATINEEFENYDLIHDDIEGGNLFNLRRLFGRKLAERIQKPKKDGPSESLEEMYYNVDERLKSKKPFIYIVDSMDGLQSKADEEKFEEEKKAHKSGKSTSGSYGTVAKINSKQLKRLMTPLAKTKSILVIISQTRDQLGFSFDPKTRSGGRALPFYASVEIWASVKQKIKKKVKGKDYPIGTITRIRIKKNRITGKDRTIDIPIYYSTGFDDIGSCIDFLLENSHWKTVGRSIVAHELNFKGPREKLIRVIEEAPLNYRKLQNVVAKVWNEIEDELSVKRKNRYA